MKNKKKFNEFMTKVISELKEEERYATAHIHQSALYAFTDFCKSKNIFFYRKQQDLFEKGPVVSVKSSL